ncbi:acyl carrier protein [Paraburkholderia solisilvae]|uniref:Carrier domain-containing protein n=1 Tax=Paraburkholderia solisilvae TaxID=624376 RepID=A0A6J5D038_9BURK|nr:acyl carrier protein [Paraburkholderia solisilvae]CAB3746787.1 hypothetical protein LMG29739_00271 [Paraburkholderia solisilvae]
MSSELETSSANGVSVTAEKIMSWIGEWTESRDLKVPADLNQTFSDAGFDSLHSVELAFFLEEKLGIKVDETVLYDYPTFASLADYLVGRLGPVVETRSGNGVTQQQPAANATDW